MNEKAVKMPIIYRRSEDYRILPANGFLISGGTVTSGMVVINVHADNPSIPAKSELTIHADGTGSEAFPDTPPALVREVLVGLQMRPDTMLALGKLLTDNGKLLLDQIQQAQIKPETAPE